MDNEIEIRVCQIDETFQDDRYLTAWVAKKQLEESWNLYDAVIGMRESLVALFTFSLEREVREYASLIVYSCEHPTRRKRIPMNVDQMVKDWIPLIRKLATAHDVDEKDAASAGLDDLLAPVIAAPVTQIREFYRKLVAEMKADPAVPWALWKLFEYWGTNVLDQLKKEEMVTLKTEIATRIAQSSVDQIPREDWINSMIGALQWRSQERLEAVETNLKAGHKPRVRGRESCLFMSVGTDPAGNAVEVML